jgi:CHAD domain-containing protein
VKNFREQLNFLCEEWPAKTAEMIRQLKSLGDHLGDDHDLVLLRKFAQEQCQPSGETLALARLIDAKRRELQDIIWQLGSQLYRDVPDQACDQLKKDWKNWRRQR